jgi:pimeloyl-ACP methyl ester carboxylesterase
MSKQGWGIAGLVVLLGAVAVLAGIYCHFDEETEILTPAVRQAAPGSFVQLPDGVVHYELAGPKETETVVLVHGFSVPYYLWDPTFDALVKAGFRALRYDLYGRGYSDRPDVEYNADLYDRQLIELLDALEIRGRANLVGVSMGGPIVVAFAVRHPERVRTLSLFDPAYLTGRKPPFRLRAPLLGEFTMDVFVAPTLAEGQLNDFFHPERYPEWPDKYRPQMRYQGFRRAILSTIRQYLTIDDREEYRAIGRSKMPVLLVWGKADQDVPFSVGADVLRAIPQAEFHPIEGAAHIPHYERADLVNPILVNFLRSSATATGK